MILSSCTWWRPLLLKHRTIAIYCATWNAQHHYTNIMCVTSIISGELIVSRYVAESITTDAGHFGHVGLCQLRTKLYSSCSIISWCTVKRHACLTEKYSVCMSSPVCVCKYMYQRVCCMCVGGLHVCAACVCMLSHVSLWGKGSRSSVRTSRE